MNRISISIGFVYVGLFAALGAWAQIVETSLNGLAKKGEDGKIIVLHDGGGAWGNNQNAVAAAAFDNNPDTFYDPNKPDDSWVGYELPEPKMLTRVRVKGRLGQTIRMTGCLFQGANDKDFTDGLYTFCQGNPPSGWDPAEWYEIPLVPVAKKFKFFRIKSNPEPANSQQGKHCGNVSELEFFGADVPLEPEMLTSPAITLSPQCNNRVVFRIPKVPGALSYQIERKFAYEVSFTKIAEVADFRAPGNTVIFADPEVLKYKATYRVVAFYSEQKKSGYSAELTVNSDPYVLTGRVLGVGYTNSGRAHDQVFDGDLQTGMEADGWIGLDLGEPRVIKGVRYCPRLDGDWKMKDGVFQISETADFIGGVTDLYTILEEPPKDEKMTEVMFEQPRKGRYVRFKPASGTTCNVNEIEFLGDGSPSGGPKNLRVTWKSRENAIARLTWSISPQDFFHKMIVQRATAPGGPWTDLAKLLPNAEKAWEDDTALYAAKYYYRIAYTNEIDGVQTSLTFTDSVSWCRVHWLERDLGNFSTLREGVTAFWSATQSYGGNEPDYSAAFDNNTGTAASGNAAGGRIGVEFEKPYVIAFVRASPRRDQNRWRLGGAEVWATTEGEDRGGGGRKIAGPFPEVKTDNYFAVPVDAIFAEQPFKAVFLKKDDGFWCNVGEMEIYGYAPDEIPADILLAPETVTVSYVDNTVKVSWTGGKNAASYRVERKASTDNEWQIVQSGITDALTLDDPVAELGVHYFYRVASVRPLEGGTDSELAYSKPVEALFYTSGDGTGFHAVFTQPYNPTSVEENERVVLTLKQQPASFNREGITELSEDRFFSVWTANLIVPVDGVYTFKMKHDDGAALWIDDRQVINERWDGNRENSEGSIYLTTGNHPIRVDYNGLGGDEFFELKWSGVIPEEIIPVSQLVSVIPGELSSGWKGDRTFNLPKKGHVSFPEEGKIVFQAGGRDIWGENEGFHFLWTTAEGDFEATMKYELPDSPRDNLGCKIILMARNALKVGETTFLGPAAQATGGKYNYNGVARLQDTAAIMNLTPDWAAGSQTGWLKLRRKGHAFISWWKADAEDEWKKIGENQIGTFNKKVFVGPALTTNNEVSHATVTNFTLREIPSGTILILK